jgi:hypothetical protein
MLARMPDVNAAKLSRCIQLVAQVVSKSDALVRARRLETPLSANLSPKTEKTFRIDEHFSLNEAPERRSNVALVRRSPCKTSAFRRSHSPENCVTIF